MPLAAAVAGWVLVSSFPQGQLYRSADRNAPAMALRAEGRIDAPPWAVAEVLMNGWLHPGVMPHLLERRVVAAELCQAGAGDLPGCRRVWVYERYRPPLAGDRDYTYRIEVAHDHLADGGGFAFTWELDDQRGPPPPPGVVRMRFNKGGWWLSPDHQATRYGYRIAVDPGGSVPAWLVNLANKGKVPEIVAAVEEAARRLVQRRAAASPP
jgi:hypothetical protein